MQLELDHFFGYLHFFERVSKQAFSQARKNLSHRAFIELNQTLLEEFYRDNEYALWKGFRLIGIDGSTLQLPTSPEIRAAFGTGCHDIKGMTFARISCAYDLLNDISLDAQITRYCHNEETRQRNLKLDERALALQHIESILQLGSPPKSSDL